MGDIGIACGSAGSFGRHVAGSAVRSEIGAGAEASGRAETLATGKVHAIGDRDFGCGVHRERLLDIDLHEIADRAQRTPNMRSVQCFACNVVPQRFRLDILHDEQRIVEANVVEMQLLAVNRGNQTGPSVAGASERGHPVLATGLPLRDVVVSHLVDQQCQRTRGGLKHEQPRVVDDFARREHVL